MECLNIKDNSELPTVVSQVVESAENMNPIAWHLGSRDIQTPASYSMGRFHT